MRPRAGEAVPGGGAATGGWSTRCEQQPAPPPRTGEL